jgi:methylated-DNA-[protein]-cysteine S-methyltransferase
VMTDKRDHDIAELIGATPQPSTAEFDALRARLVERAEQVGLLDVAYRTVDSPVGTLLLAATPTGIVRIAYECEGLDEVLMQIAAKVSPRVIAAPRRLDPAVRQLDEYFAHLREGFDLPLDLSLSSGFRRRVLQHLPAIGYGRTESYATVALAVDNPKAVRAVGSACATNPLPLLIPCHRVVRSDGRIGDYIGGALTKRHLLDMEATA